MTRIRADEVAPENPTGLFALLDTLVIFLGEAAKSLTQQTFLLVGQVINGAVGLFLSLTFEPGYDAARKARLAVARAAHDLAERSGTRFAAISNILQDIESRIDPGTSPQSDLNAANTRNARASATEATRNLLEESGEIIEHQNQPRSTRWAPGIVEGWRIGTLVAIDRANQAIRRFLARISGRDAEAMFQNPRHVLRPSALSLRHIDPLLEPTPFLSARARKRRTSHQSATKAAPSLRRARSLSTSKRSVATEKVSPAKPHAGTYHSNPRVSKAYRPLPRLEKLSAACHIIDTVCGYPVQTYAVRTVDGYILTLVRIPRVESRNVVFFQHGLLDSASAWVSTGNVHSLAARAYQAGYDVFLGNMRGSNDALGINGLGANPVDYRDRAAAHKTKQSSEVRQARSPLRGEQARVRSLSSASIPGVDFVGASTDGIPVHETLHPRQAEYWNYSVDDHALDVMAFMRQIRIIKALEHSERQQQPTGASAATTRQDSRSGDNCASLEKLAEEVLGVNRPSMAESVGVEAASDIGDAASALAEPLHQSRMRRDVVIRAPEEKAALARKEEMVGEAVITPSSAKSVASSTPHSPLSIKAQPASGQPESCVDSPAVDMRDAMSRPENEKLIDATSSLADDCKIVAVGHSMGGCILLMYVMICNALQRPHWITKQVLLSPAGLHRHLAWPFKVLLFSLYRLGVLNIESPFPVRSSKLQRFGARVLQDLKRTQAIGDLMAVLGSYFFGGERHRFVFRFVSFTDYPIGGSNFKVVRHGIQTMIAKDFQPYDHGQRSNLERYGTSKPPSYRLDYGLLTTPIHIIAGGRDLLVPAANLEEQFALMNMIHPGLVTMREFDRAGHLDFTLTLSDDIISHVLDEVESGFADSPPISAKQKTLTITHDRTSTMFPTSPVAAASAEEGQPDLQQLPPRILQDRSLAEELQNLATRAKDRLQRSTDTLGWRPSRECLVDYPWLGCFSKLESALDGFDREAQEMGLMDE